MSVGVMEHLSVSGRICHSDVIVLVFSTNGTRSSITDWSLVTSRSHNKNHTVVTESHTAMLSRSLTPHRIPSVYVMFTVCITVCIHVPFF